MNPQDASAVLNSLPAKLVFKCFKVVCTVFVGIGAVSFLAGLYFLIAHIIFYMTSVKVEGKVTSTVSVQDEGTIGTHESPSEFQGDLLYRPIITYATIDGHTFTYSSKISYTSRDIDSEFPNGEAKMIYSPQHPSDALVYSFSELWLLPCIGFFGGIILMVLGLVVKYSIKKAENKIRQVA